MNIQKTTTVRGCLVLKDRIAIENENKRKRIDSIREFTGEMFLKIISISISVAGFASNFDFSWRP